MCREFAKTWSPILSYALAHFNIICKHYNIAKCGSFNLSDLLHHFFSHSTTCHSIFLPSEPQNEFLIFNKEEQIFLSTTLQTAFLASSMHSTIQGKITFPSHIQSDQAATFTQHWTHLLDSPPTCNNLTSNNTDTDTSSFQVPISRIPFSIFVYLGLLNSIMIDIWSIFTQTYSHFIKELNYSIIHIVLSFSSLPDGIWCRTISSISDLAHHSIISVAQLCKQVDFFHQMNTKLHTIFCFPICTTGPLNSLSTHSSRNVLNAMLQTLFSILSHRDFKLSDFYDNSHLHQQCTYFALQIVYIYLTMQTGSVVQLQLTSSSSNFSIQHCLHLFQHLCHSQRHAPTISHLFNSGTAPSSISSHVFCMITSIINRFAQNPQPFLASIAPFLLDNLNFASKLYTNPQFSHLISSMSTLNMFYIKFAFATVKASPFDLRLISTPFLQFFYLNQALKYYFQQIYKQTSDIVFCDIICTKIPYTLTSVIIEGTFEENLLQLYSSSSRQFSLYSNQQKLLDDQLSQTLISISAQILSDNLYIITPVHDIAIGLQACQENTTTPAEDVLFHASTLLSVNPIINVIPYMAIHHNFNKTLYHSIVCHPWPKQSISSSRFFWIFGYLELYHTFLCKSIIISMIDEISATSGQLFEIKWNSFSHQDAKDISEQLCQFAAINSFKNEKNLLQSPPLALSYTWLGKTSFDMTHMSQHPQFRSSLHKHSHLPQNVVLLYYSYTEALVSVIMGFSYTKFHLGSDNHPIMSFFDQSTNELSSKINTLNDQCIEPISHCDFPCSSLSCGTIFQILEDYERRSAETQDYEYDELHYQYNDENDQDGQHIDTIGYNDAYSEHILSLYNSPHQLTQVYVPSNRQPIPALVGSTQTPGSCNDKTSEEIPLTLEWSSAMVQHTIELFIDLLLNEHSYAIISQINFSDGNPLAQQSKATLNYFGEDITVALSEMIAQHQSSAITDENLPISSKVAPIQPFLPSLPMENLPYFYNLTEQQQVTLHKTYSYDALFSAKYGPIPDDLLAKTQLGEIPEFNEADLSHVLTDVNTTIPNWLELLFIQSREKLTSESTQYEGLRFNSL